MFTVPLFRVQRAHAVCSPIDNQKRANRLQQLVDSMANMQTDVIGFAKKMDDANTKYRPAIDGLLRANGLATIEDLIALTASRMTPQEKAVFEAVSSPPTRAWGGLRHRADAYFLRLLQLINTARESKSVSPRLRHACASVFNFSFGY